jgi:hypothetical protein
MAGERHGRGMLCVNRPLCSASGLHHFIALVALLCSASGLHHFIALVEPRLLSARQRSSKQATADRLLRREGRRYERQRRDHKNADV